MGLLKRLFHREKKVLVIGLDGVPFSLLKELIESDNMPFLRDRFKSGVFKAIKSPLPEISSVSWSTFMTGRDSGSHRIFGFTDVDRNYSIFFPDFRYLRGKTFWDFLGEKGKRSIVVNLPFTYPVKPMNGILISGFVSIRFEKSVFPQTLLPFLNSIGYKIDVDNSKGREEREEFLSELFSVLAKRFVVARKFLKEEKFNLFMLTITGTDRLHHFFMKSFRDKNSPFHDSFIKYYRKIDTLIGDFLSSMDEDYHLIMLSDHGFTELHREVLLNRVLAENGLLKLKDGIGKKFEDIDFSRSLCFSLDPARIYLNTEDRFEGGVLSDESEIENVIERVKGIFENLEFNGRRVIKRVYRREELYSERFLNLAPHILLEPEDGFCLKASIDSEEIFRETHFEGMHTRENAFFYGDYELNFNPESIESVQDVGNLIFNSF